jgi:lactate dehydrogenase-like 2-hydroxyacid dehydrogenase
MRPVVLVTEPEFRRAEATFANAADVRCEPAPSDEAALAEAVRRSGVRHVVVGHLPYRGPLYQAVPRGGVIARFGVGFDGIDRTQATAAGLLCTNTPEVLDQSVAELTMLLVASVARHVTILASAMQNGTWQPQQGTELLGKTLAIAGAGRIGRATARIAALGYGMRVVGIGRGAGADAARASGWFAEVTDDWAAGVNDAHFVSVHIPATPANAQFVNADRLAQCRPGACLVNTARGAVIDEVALYDALASRRLAAAGLDVFDREPYVPVTADHDLRRLPNVVLTPHVGSNTADANRRMAERALQNVTRAIAEDFAGMDIINR